MKKRQDKIIELINTFDIDTQSELTERLKAEGYDVTQSTVSRDIRKLQLTKLTDETGKSKYILPQYQYSNEVGYQLKNKYITVLHDGIMVMLQAGNLLVVKTLSGMAMAVATAIDSLKIEGIVGCIAGDDTVFCAISSDSDINDVKEFINKLMDR